MIDLRKNDLIDAVFDRYKESCKHALDTDKYMYRKDIDAFYARIRRGMRKDFKQIDREFRKVKRREWRASVWAWFKKLFKKLFPWFKKKSKPTTPAEPPAPDVPTAPVEPTSPAEPTTPVEPTVPDVPTTPVEPTVPEAIIPDTPVSTERVGTSEPRRAERGTSELCATPRRDTDTRTLSPRDPEPISPDTTAIIQAPPIAQDEPSALDEDDGLDTLTEFDEPYEYPELDDVCPIV